ncbi:MAG TPA: ATP-binding protein [Polyangiales bacterium]|nr:ATP-binding protein [Polyangiales bacterium]
MAIVRIAVSGGPGAGKTTLWRTIAKAHKQRVVAVPEVATMLFSHVFPGVQNEQERCAVQRAIFEVQRSVEQIYEGRMGADQILWCDRGVPDGAGYWPHGHADFFETMQTEWQAELARYDAVLFLESAAVGGLSIASGNTTRTEDLVTACALDQRLKQVWQAHPRFHHIPHETDFVSKLTNARKLAESLLP